MTDPFVKTIVRLVRCFTVFVRAYIWPEIAQDMCSLKQISFLLIEESKSSRNTHSQFFFVDSFRGHIVKQYGHSNSFVETAPRRSLDFPFAEEILSAAKPMLIRWIMTEVALIQNLDRRDGMNPSCR
jgi:hypothetical protein